MYTIYTVGLYECVCIYIYVCKYIFIIIIKHVKYNTN